MVNTNANIIGVYKNTQIGEGVLTAGSYILYDFSDLTFADEANIANGDAGLVDQGPNSNTATIIGTPTCNEITYYGGTRKGVRSVTTNMLSSNTQGDSYFNGSFEVHWGGRLEDGQPAATTYICGAADGSTARIGVSIISGGNLQLSYRATSGGGQTQQTATTASFANGALNNVYVRVIFDFITDTFSAYINGSLVTPWNAVSGTAIASQDPSTFNSGQNLYIGGNNNSGTPSSQGAEITTVRFAVTPLLSAEEAVLVSNFFTFAE